MKGVHNLAHLKNPGNILSKTSLLICSSQGFSREAELLGVCRGRHVGEGTGSHG